MSNDDLDEFISLLIPVLGQDLEYDIRKILSTMKNRDTLRLGIRDGYDLISKDLLIGTLQFFDEEESVVDKKFKPNHFFANDNSYYFGTEEMIRFNSKKKFLCITGKLWFDNERGSEFVEAIIFGNHSISSIDCMLGSIKINNPFDDKIYLSSGTIVVVEIEEFKNTKYLVLSRYLAKVFIANDEANPWELINNSSKKFSWTNNQYLPSSDFFNTTLQNTNYYEETEEDYESYSEYGGGPTGDLSDDFIDDVLGGDPDAYWNID